MMRNLRKIGSYFLLISVLGITSVWAAPVINSRFEPSSLVVGETGNFIIDIKDAKSVGQITPPSVAGVRFNLNNIHRSARTMVINGERSSSMSFIIQVRGTQVGEFYVPAFMVPVNGAPMEVPGVTVQVTDAPPPPTHVGKNTPLALQLDLAREKIYVGETLPARIKLYVSNGLSASLGAPGFPLKEGDAFAESLFNTEPEQRSIQKDNQSFQEVTWNTTITPLKAGSQALQFNLNLLVASPPSEDDFFRNQQLFNSPFGSIFNNIMPEYDEKLLTTGNQTIEVAELPNEGKPEDFAGAIGLFTIEQPVFSTLEAQVGDPITLSFKITGAGNFSRLEAPNLNLPREWKTYTPKSDYQPKDSLGYRGEKTFEYILVPQVEGTLEIPSLPFTFFNPEKGEYITKKLDLPPIKVRPAVYVNGSAPKPVQPAPAKEEPALPISDSGLLPNKLDLGATVSSITPVYKQSFFWVMQTALLMGLIAWVAIKSFINKRSDLKGPHDRIAQAKEAYRKAMEQVQEAADKREASRFYEYALVAIRNHLKTVFPEQSEAFIFAEIEVALREKNIDSRTLDDLKHFFETADAFKFGGGMEHGVTFSDEMKRLQEVLNGLSACSRMHHI